MKPYDDDFDNFDDYDDFGGFSSSDNHNDHSDDHDYHSHNHNGSGLSNATLWWLMTQDDDRGTTSSPTSSTSYRGYSAKPSKSGTNYASYRGSGDTPPKSNTKSDTWWNVFKICHFFVIPTIAIICIYFYNRDSFWLQLWLYLIFFLILYAIWTYGLFKTIYLIAEIIAFVYACKYIRRDLEKDKRKQ